MEAHLTKNTYLPIRSANVDLIGLVLKVGSTVSLNCYRARLGTFIIEPTSTQQEQVFLIHLHKYGQAAGATTASDNCLGILLLIATPFMRVLVSLAFSPGS